MFARNSRLTGEIEYYYSGDPAFDTYTLRTDITPPDDAPDDWAPPPVFDYKAWLETGDESHLPRKPNAAAVKIVCKRLSPTELAYVEDVGSVRGQHQAFLALVRLQVQRLVPHPPNDPPVERVVIDGLSMLCDEWAEYLRHYEDGKLYYELVGVLYSKMSPSSRS